MNRFLSSFLIKRILYNTFIISRNLYKNDLTSSLCREKYYLSNENKSFQHKFTSKAYNSTKKIYYQFLCKCGMGCNTFNDFLSHIESNHQISNLNFQELFKGKEGYKQEIRFYWSLKCHCGHRFSSSLCHAELEVFNCNIKISKIYNLRCLKCEKIAIFDEGSLLNSFLEERFKQKLIYKYFVKNFEPYKFDFHSSKKLEGHIRNLCEKCQMSSTGFCLDIDNVANN
jgi:hypothetical protein